MTHHDDIFTLLMGTSGKLMRAHRFNQPLIPYFFRPYDGLDDLGCRIASIFTAPVLASFMAIGSALYAGFWLLVGQTDEAKEMASLSGQFLIATVSASLVNLIDLVGSAISTLAHEIVNSL